MCSYITHSAEVVGKGYARGEWIGLERAVVAFDHPAELGVEHALCIDLRSAAGPSERVAVELDEASARALAHAILAALPEG
jgi:hypothetical protein